MTSPDACLALAREAQMACETGLCDINTSRQLCDAVETLVAENAAMAKEHQYLISKEIEARSAHDAAHKLANLAKTLYDDAKKEWEGERENYIRDVVLMAKAAGVDFDAPEAMADDIRSKMRNYEQAVQALEAQCKEKY